jgi:hypothetical protein
MVTALVNLARFFSFLFYEESVGPLRRGFSPSHGRYLHTEHHKRRITTQTSMSQVGFESTIAVLKRAKTVHALDRAATVIGMYVCMFVYN